MIYNHTVGTFIFLVVEASIYIYGANVFPCFFGNINQVPTISLVHHNYIASVIKGNCVLSIPDRKLKNKARIVGIGPFIVKKLLELIKISIKKIINKIPRNLFHFQPLLLSIKANFNIVFTITDIYSIIIIGPKQYFHF